MRMLDLFSGTGSVSRVFEEAGWECVSVDIDPKFNPTICCSVLDIPIDRWEPGYFDYIHASPVCREYSRAHTGSQRDLEAGDLLVVYALQLIEALAPCCGKKFCWTLENPATGLLASRGFMASYKFCDTAYCMYAFNYRKLTRFWYGGFDLKLLKCDGNCGAMIGKRHMTSAQKGPDRHLPTDVCYTTEQLYRIPRGVVQSILEQILSAG
jgi:hypothetical protein